MGSQTVYDTRQHGILDRPKQRFQNILQEIFLEDVTDIWTEQTRNMLPHDLCARLQNAFRARHQKIAVDHNTQNLGILSILLRAGFIANATRGTLTAPPLLSSTPPASPSVGYGPTLCKYRDDQLVLRNMELVSKPSKKVHMDLSEIRLICSRCRAQQVKLLGMGEIAEVRTKDKEHEWLEARDALQLKLAGEVVCRAR